MQAKNKNQATDADVPTFIEALEDPQQKQDSLALLTMMEEITDEPARMWGPGIIGFGRYHYRYESGREGDFMRVGFSPRKGKLALYIIPGFEPFSAILQKLGKHSTGKSCLYIKSLSAVDQQALKELLHASVLEMERRYPRQ